MDAVSLQGVERVAAQGIVSDARHDMDVGPERRGVAGEVDGSTAQARTVGEEIPQQLAQSDDHKAVTHFLVSRFRARFLPAPPMTSIPINSVVHEIAGCEKTHSQGAVGTTTD